MTTQSVDLQKRAMLITLSIRLEGLLGERRDKAASELVESTYSVASKRAKASKYLIDRKHPKVKAVIAAAQQVRAVVYRYTFPCGDSGLRLLPIKAFPDFKNRVHAAMEDLKATQEAYLLAYPSLVAASESELGGLFDRSQYPSVERVKHMFKCGVQFLPMPDSGHFVADIANDAANEIRESIARDNERRIQEAVNDLIDRVEKSISFYVDKLSTYENEGDNVRGIFRDSLVANIQDMATLVRQLNVTDNPGILALATQIDRIGTVAASELRESKDKREAMVAQGQTLLAKLDSYRQMDVVVDEHIDSVADYYN